MTPQHARALVSAIDLAAVAAKVRIQQGWDSATADRAEREYREYLTAARLDPAFAAPPSRLADELWHAHILDTAKYAADCDRVFGAFLHHVPNYQPYLTAAAGCVPCFGQREAPPTGQALRHAPGASSGARRLTRASRRGRRARA